jgi:K+-transporting ATPase ATPase C chain
MILVLTVVVGLAYPLAMTAFAQVAFPHRADGSIVTVDGTKVGSSLLGQSFGGKPQYFQSRPSAAGEGYDPLASSASNLGPTSRDLLQDVRQRRAAAARLDGTSPAAVDTGALTASGSGLDPDISPAYAAQQVDRVAAARHLDPSVVRRLVQQGTRGRQLGFLGEPRVNVLLLNLALDRVSGR